MTDDELKALASVKEILGKVGAPTRRHQMTALAKAIVEARNAALEEAAEVADWHRDKWAGAGGFHAEATAAKIIAASIRIRALKGGE